LEGRHILKDEDRAEKRKCIDDEKTFAEKGYRSVELKPASNKKVWAVCANPECEREGGRGRWVQFRYCTELCYLCAHRTDEFRRKNSESHKGKVASDETKRRMRNAQKGENNCFYGKHHTEDAKRKISDANEGKILSKETKRKISDAQKGENGSFYGKHHSDEAKQKMRDTRKDENNPRYGKHLTEETKRKISDALKGEKNHNFGKHLTDETKKKMSDSIRGENHYNWKGGISFEPYCHKFNYLFKKSIRDKFGRKCFICNKTEKDNGERLSVHHVSYDKECMCDGVECEFVPTCRSCNSILNSSRDLWERLIINVLSYEGWI
jgi:hypothetical protein